MLISVLLSFLFGARTSLLAVYSLTETLSYIIRWVFEMFSYFCHLKELCFQKQQRPSFVKNNTKLSTAELIITDSSVTSMYAKIANLTIYPDFAFSSINNRTCLKLHPVACLKSRGIVENKSGVALECERPMDVMYSLLYGQLQGQAQYQILIVSKILLRQVQAS